MSFWDLIVFSKGFFVLMNDWDFSSWYSIFSNVDYDTYHARLGHIVHNRMIKLANKGMLGDVSKGETSPCEHCLLVKSTRKPFRKGTRVEYSFMLIHSDICGPMIVMARHGVYYFITFINDFSQYG